MHVFVTGATGWVGSAVVEDLIAAGHEVSGLARSKDKARALAAAGAHVIHGSLEDSDILRHAAQNADAVIHTAFNHDFSRFVENCEQDRRVIEQLGAAIEGSDRMLLVTSGLSGMASGATELDQPKPVSPRQSEAAANVLSQRGVHVAAVRLAPSVHGLGDHGFIPILVRLARETGVSAWYGDGQNVWSGVHRRDAARVYRLALEQGVTERVYHAVADQAVPFQAIAQALAHQLGLPAEAREREHFGWFANMAAGNMAVSSVRTRALLDWMPTGPDLLTELNNPAYYTHI
ncbi:SDR family oxidoreductase [Candidatus Pantoea floridensis]|uniref:Nucleoside-diphosphate-sugar epimerase n=1 Tax=Candidatus Pantoea floridensis TaxID=1938870 RepID=A0A286BRX1_9GAMM|nr:SDR family oxidoreductase [Pantoea floridensis]PIF23450.1 nucleoside-diphosphate-sugar epimerase [Enterobacteriaceae bacterium JKS000233]SOD36903.1 Nucleoside-diphosphate-sugar epimerase [Pantoea floridensis]